MRNMIQHRNGFSNNPHATDLDRTATLPALSQRDVEAIAEHTADALRDLIDHDTLSPATRRAYAGALRYWNAWSMAATGADLALLRSPREVVAVDTVLAFVAQHVAVEVDGGEVVAAMPDAVRQRMIALGAFGVRRAAATGGDPALLTLASVRHRLAALQACHRLAGLVPTYVDDPRVRQAIRALGNRTARVATNLLRKPKAPITRGVLTALLAACSSDPTPQGVRDAAIFRIGFGTGGRRRSEIVSMRLRDLDRSGDSWVWHLATMKGRTATDASGSLLAIPVLGNVVTSLSRWLATLRSLDPASATTPGGAVFRRLHCAKAGDRVEWHVGRPMTGHDVWQMIRKRAGQAGLNPTKFGAHSLRSGAATSFLEEGGSLADASAMLDHSRMETTRGYDHRGVPVAAVSKLSGTGDEDAA